MVTIYRLAWVPASTLKDFTSLNNGLEDEKTKLWWRGGMDATLTKQSKSYKGTIVESVDDLINECETESDDEEQGPTTEEYEFIISYEDSDAEILNAKKLAFKQLQTSDRRK